MRRHLLVLPLLLAGAGCSSPTDDAASPPSSTPSSTPSTAPSGHSVPSWNPCDDVTPEEVADLLGEAVTEETGTPGAMRCTYVPVAEGGPTLDLNYLWFDGSFDEAWDTIGDDVAGTVRDLDVPGADAARTVVQVRDGAVLVTGFVQTAGLIESVNAIALDPADKGRLLRATRGVLALLSNRAPAAARSR